MANITFNYDLRGVYYNGHAVNGVYYNGELIFNSNCVHFIEWRYGNKDEYLITTIPISDTGDGYYYALDYMPDEPSLDYWLFYGWFTDHRDACYPPEQVIEETLFYSGITDVWAKWFPTQEQAQYPVAVLDSVSEGLNYNDDFFHGNYDWFYNSDSRYFRITPSDESFQIITLDYDASVPAYGSFNDEGWCCCTSGMTWRDYIEKFREIRPSTRPYESDEIVYDTFALLVGLGGDYQAWSLGIRVNQYEDIEVFTLAQDDGYNIGYSWIINDVVADDEIAWNVYEVGI